MTEHVVKWFTQSLNHPGIRRIFRIMFALVLAALTLALMFLSLGVQPVPVRAAGNVLYVAVNEGDDQGGSNDCRLPGSPCQTIGHAGRRNSGGRRDL